MTARLGCQTVLALRGSVFRLGEAEKKEYIQSLQSLSATQHETSLPAIPTFSRSLDEALGSDGVQLGVVTELLGLPGVGKLQLCLQLCAAVQVPKALGGLEAEALFIDTNTKFTILRFVDILKASMSKCQRLLGETADVEIEKYLDRFHFVDAFGLDRFRAVLQDLPIFLRHHPNIKLIAIDSICFPFKDGTSERLRTGILFTELASLQRIALEKQIAVVITNEMSTRIGLSDGEVVGAMGDAWAHRCNARVLLSAPRAARPERTALLLKSNSAPQNVAHFQVTAEGIRDLEKN